MLDFGFRWYDPAIGRWSAVDPLAELAPNLTPYRYGFNNPIRYTDPFGLYETEGKADRQRRRAQRSGLDVGEVYKSGDEWVFNVVNGEDSYTSSNKKYRSRTDDLITKGRNWSAPGGGAQGIAETMISLNPVFDASNAITGQNVVTNEELSSSRRAGSAAMAGFAFIPGFSAFRAYRSTFAVYKTGKTGMTVAGHSLTKHPHLLGYSSWTALQRGVGNAPEINKAASEIIKNLMRNGNASTKFVTKDGRLIMAVEYKIGANGVRFDLFNNSFMHFLGKP